jgi:uncharacterized protein
MAATPSEKPLAVVTGASSGIGLELARQFARHDFAVLVVAEDAELDAARADLAREGAPVEAVRADLRTDDGVHAVVAAVGGRPVDALALNAGVGAGGSFAGPGKVADLEQELSIVDLNCRSTIHLAKHLIPPMVSRGQGRVLVTSSVASTTPGAFQAVYNASKSFTQSWAEGIREELKDTGVTVTSLMPGPTDSEFFDRADLTDTKLGASDAKDSPEQVAEQGFEGLMAGKQQVVAGSRMNTIQARAGRLVPDALKAKAHRQMAEPGSAED